MTLFRAGGRRALGLDVYLRLLRPQPLLHVLRRVGGEVLPAPEQGRDIAALARAAQRLGDIVADAGEAIEIAVDDRLRLAPVAAQPSGKAESGYAVEDGEVDRLGAPARVAVDLAEQLLRGQVVDVGPVGEGLLQCGHKIGRAHV